MSSRDSLTDAQLRLLWRLAQHKYGWTYCPRQFGGNHFRTAEVLERHGLVTIDREEQACSATDEGRAVIAALFPVSPYILGTYDHQPSGWTPCPV